jgi:hypothetical protein
MCAWKMVLLLQRQCTERPEVREATNGNVVDDSDVAEKQAAMVTCEDYVQTTAAVALCMTKLNAA